MLVPKAANLRGLPEVTIVIDNQDGRMPVEFTEVQVTRRVFRSGESEYRINGAACRLKDIQELFMDTGRRQRRLFHRWAGQN